MLEMNNIYLMDCMEGMKQFPDKYFELAIVDPPYGINITKSNRLATSRCMGGKNWDSNIPDYNYFEELFRVSKNQIIWGWNYFVPYLNSCRCYIVWDKKNDGLDFADSETAWTSFDKVARTFRMRPMNMDGGKIHPTQKPIQLYKWLLKNYAKPGDKILDTHGGSFSSVIACLEMGFEYIAFEIDEEYYKNGIKRINNYKSQLKLFL